MTRVRVEVSDEQRTDLAAPRQLPGVKGYIKQGEQHQFIVGARRRQGGGRHARIAGR